MHTAAIGTICGIYMFAQSGGPETNMHSEWKCMPKENATLNLACDYRL